MKKFRKSRLYDLCEQDKDEEIVNLIEEDSSLLRLKNSFFESYSHENMPIFASVNYSRENSIQAFEQSDFFWKRNKINQKKVAESIPVISNMNASFSQKFVKDRSTSHID